MTDNAIVLYDETEKVAKAMVASGYFTDVKQVSQTIVKIMAGRELGFGAFASMAGVNVIQGKPTLGANLLASAIKSTNKYNYRVLEMTDKACEVEFYEDGKPVGKSRFDWSDAEKAGLTGKDNWKRYPRNMLFARAISNGQKWYCPDACNGVTVYTPDEMGATVDEDDRVIDLPQHRAEKELTLIKQSTVDEAMMRQAAHDAIPVEPVHDLPDQDGEPPIYATGMFPRPYPAAELRGRLATKAANYANKTASEKQRKLAAMLLSEIFAGPDSDLQRHAVQLYLFGASSLGDVSDAYILVMLNDWLKPVKDSGGAYISDEMAVKEAQGAYLEAVKAQGQQELPL